MNGKDRGISGRGDTWLGRRPTVYDDGRKIIGKGFAAGDDYDKLLIQDLDSALEKAEEERLKEENEQSFSKEDIDEDLAETLRKNNISIEWSDR